jgi:hypothetical protein
MVNFNDPALIDTDVGACDSQPLSLELGSSPGPPLSGTQEVPVFGGWFLHVGLPRYNVLHNSTSYSQLGVYDHSWLRVEYHPKASPIQMDDMGR